MIERCPLTKEYRKHMLFVRVSVRPGWQPYAWIDYKEILYRCSSVQTLGRVL